MTRQERIHPVVRVVGSADWRYIFLIAILLNMSLRLFLTTTMLIWYDNKIERFFWRAAGIQLARLPWPIPNLSLSLSRTPKISDWPAGPTEISALISFLPPTHELFLIETPPKGKIWDLPSIPKFRMTNYRTKIRIAFIDHIRQTAIKRPLNMRLHRLPTSKHCS